MRVSSQVRWARRIGAMAVVALAAAACGGSSSGGGGGGADSEAVNVLIGGTCKIIYLPGVLAKQLGYYKDAGIDVKILSKAAAGGAVADAVLTEQVAASVSFYDHNVDLAGLGKSTKAFVILDQVPGEAVVVQPSEAGEIKGPSDLAGKSFGVTSLGGSGAFLAKYLAKRHGVAVSDFTLIKAGVGPAFIAALDHKAIDVGMTTEPTVSTVLQSGKGKLLIDMRTVEGTKEALGGLYPGGSMYASANYIEEHPDNVQALATAMVRTLEWIHSHSAAEIAAKMPADCAGGKPDLYEQAIQNSLEMFTTDGVMPPDGPQTVLNVLSSFDENVQGKDIDLDATFTNEFVQKAAAGG